jgi:hypothetical protein
MQARLGFSEASFEEGKGGEKYIKISRQRKTGFEGGGDIRTVSIPRMYEETCISIKADVACGR